MLTAADLIQALQRRLLLQAPHRHRTAGEFPPGWKAWLADMAMRPGRVTGVPPAAIVDVLAQRAPRPAPRRVGDLTRWQAFGAMWRQQWHAPIPEERGLRRFAVAMTGLIHLVLGAMLFWLALLQFLGVPITREGETVVQVEYIGDGTPEAPGGGDAPPQVQDSEPDASAQAAQEAASESAASAALPSLPMPSQPPQATPDLQAPLPDIAQRDVPEPQLPVPSEPVAEQPVAVTEPRNDEPVTFVLPPPTLRPRTDPAAPELRAPTPNVSAREVAEPVQPIQREIPPRPMANPALAARSPTVSERAIPEPLQRPTLPAREVPVRPITAPELAARTPQVRRVDVPTPQPRPGSATPSAAAAPAAASTASAPRATAATPSSGPATSSRSAATRPSAAGRAGETGVGPRSTPTPGAFPTTRRSDDWGDADRNRPGAQAGGRPGLYNPDGSLRVPGPPGSASPGQPPGTITDEIADLDRAGTWLKRRPNEFEPTRFEQYWRPHQNLLEEWVSKGIKKVMVPIPGTTKKLECVVSLLQAAGGCTVSDPNLNEQPASARPPPDIPFKPELQEDNGSVKPTP